MARPGKKPPATPEQRLARALLAAVIEAGLEGDPHHDDPEWDEAGRLLRGACGVYQAGPWLSVARALIRRGVSPPGVK